MPSSKCLWSEAIPLLIRTPSIDFDLWWIVNSPVAILRVLRDHWIIHTTYCILLILVWHHLQIQKKPTEWENEWNLFIRNWVVFVRKIITFQLSHLFLVLQSCNQSNKVFLTSKLFMTLRLHRTVCKSHGVQWPFLFKAKKKKKKNSQKEKKGKQKQG